MTDLYPKHTDYHGEWHWPNFTSREVSCNCCGEYFHDHKSLTALQLLRDRWGKPIIINSGHRCPSHNREIQGAPRSYHLKIAFDCRCPAEEQDAFATAARIVGFKGIIQYRSKGIVHLDTRKDPYGRVIP